LTSSDDEDSKTGNIGVIEITGIITESISVLEQIEEARKSSSIKAVVVRVDSPGGAVGASQEIYMELKKLKKTHPVIVSMGDLAASGGLYISLGADSIFALPGTLTGSMGVIMQLTNLSKLMEKIYVEPLTIKSGELKDAGNPMRPMDPKAKQYFQDLILKTFQTFRSTVKEERKLSDETIQLLSDGRVVDGNQAVQLKLADQIGTFQDAVNMAKEKGKVSGEVKLAYLSRKPKPFVERIFSSALEPVQHWVKAQTNILEYRFDPMHLGK
jgi:protease-4